MVKFGHKPKHYTKMAISFLQYKTDLENAWKAVCDVKNDINWAVFGYAGKTYELKVVDQGEDGIEEMVDSLSGSKVQYAFLQIIDPNTSLPKLVLINWSGEGAPVSMKGTCARHVPDVAKLLRGAHVTINARTDDDVEEDTILKKVSSSSGSNYSFHKETASVADQAPAGPVGSVYKRTNAAAEIKAKRSDNFWNQHDEDDKRRKQEETKKRQQESQKEDAQRRKSETQAAQARDKQMSDRMQGVNQNKLQEKRRVEAEREAEQRRWEEQQNQQDSPKRNQEAAEKRKEAAALVSRRQSNPRDFFENKSREALAPPPTGYKPPITLPKADEPEPEEEPEPEQAYQPEPEPAYQPEPEPEPEAEPEPPARSPVAAALATPPAPYSRDSDEEEAPADDEWADDGPVAEPEPVAADQYEPEATYDEAGPPAEPEPTEEPLYESADGSAPEPAGGGAAGGVSATAIYDYQAGDDTEITFDPGDIITEIEEIDSGWWQGRAPDGNFGMFPSNYVERIE